MRPLILTVLFVVVSVMDGSGAQLNRISLSESAVSTRIHAYFDELPLYQERVSNRRLDLTFIDTRSTDLLTWPEPGGVIIKTLVVQDQENTKLSFFFRYPPQDLSITDSSDGTLIIDLIPGNKFTETFRELGSSLGLLTQVERGRQTLINPLTFSPYKEDWRSFFEDSHIGPILITAPAPSIPPFPLASMFASVDTQRLLFIKKLDDEDLFESLQRIQKGLTSMGNEEERPYYALTHADIIFRLGSIAAALRQYKLLADTYGFDDAGNLAVYGTALIEMGEQRFHLARVRLTNLLARLPDSHPLAPHVRLAIAETFLATGNYAQMKQLLERQDFPAALTEAVQLRRADFAYATGRFNEALTSYEKFYGSRVMAARPYSINGYCSILYSRQAYEESQGCYLDLASKLSKGSDIASAHYLAALADLLAGKASASPEIPFAAIVERFPGTEAALWAEMKLADLCLLAGDECEDNPNLWFRRISDKASSRALAESASFREALCYFLEGQQSTSIELLQSLLRTFQSGELLDQAQALIIQILPGEIKRLLDSGSIVEAIALAQQNRSFFEKGWLDDGLLLQIGLAFEKLAMHPEALQLFLYLKNNTATLDDEDLLVAAIRSAHAIGSIALVEDLASEYRYRYPQGAYGLDVLFYRLDCTYAAGRIDDALLLLPDPVPQRLDFQFLEAVLAFQTKRYRRTVDILLPVHRARQAELTADLIFVLAESLYELGEISTCRDLFILLAGTEKYHRPARHRLMQLSGKLEPEQFAEITENFPGDVAQDDPWRRFAVQASRYRRMLSTL